MQDLDVTTASIHRSFDQLLKQMRELIEMNLRYIAAQEEKQRDKYCGKSRRP